VVPAQVSRLSLSCTVLALTFVGMAGSVAGLAISSITG
jgi:hypothetical protein